MYSIEKIKEYDFFIIKEEKAKLDSNVEKKEINIDKDYIWPKRKKLKENLNDSNEKNNNMGSHHKNLEDIYNKYIF